MKKLVTIVFAFIAANCWAQNLIPNNSFEVIDSCPFSNTNINVAPPWFQPSKGTTDVFNGCAPINGVNVPNAYFGFQYAQEGIGYAGIVLFSVSPPNYREYIAVKLSDSLKENVLYCLKLHVSLADGSSWNYSISSIGVHFSPDSIYQNNDDPLQVIPQFENFNGNFINDTTSWLLIKGNYTAIGGEKYIYIGNFRNDANTVVQNPPVTARTYVFIDNVQLYECDSLIGIDENLIQPISIYPNPAQDFVSIDIPSNYTQAQLNIYNLTGQLVAQKRIQSNQNIPITELGNGMYIFVVQGGDKVWRERVVVAK